MEWLRAKSPSFARCKEGDLPLLNFSNLTCMLKRIPIHSVKAVKPSCIMAEEKPECPEKKLPHAPKWCKSRTPGVYYVNWLNDVVLRTFLVVYLSIPFLLKSSYILLFETVCIPPLTSLICEIKTRLILLDKSWHWC